MSKKTTLRTCSICDRQFPNKGFDNHFSSHVDDFNKLSFSNDMGDACKTTCLLCDKELFLGRMRAHTKDKHNINITDYKLKFDLQGFDIIDKVFHKCTLCLDIMLLDSDTIATHLNKHNITHKAYNDKYMNMMAVTKANSTAEGRKSRTTSMAWNDKQQGGFMTDKKPSKQEEVQDFYMSFYLQEKFNQSNAAYLESKVLSHDEMHLADWPHECFEELSYLKRSPYFPVHLLPYQTLLIAELSYIVGACAHGGATLPMP